MLFYLLSKFANYGKKKNPPKQPKHLETAHGAEQVHQSDEAQASVDTEELVSLRTVREMLKVQESMLRALFDSVVKSPSARVDGVVESVNSLKASWSFPKKTSRNLSPLSQSLRRLRMRSIS